MTTSLQVRHFMSPKFTTVRDNQRVIEAINLFTSRDIFGAAVVDQVGNLVGILSVTDCIGEAIQTGFNPNTDKPVSTLMSKDVRTVDADANLLDVAKMFLEQPYRRYPVMDDNQVVGVITRLEVLKGLKKLMSS